MLAAGNLAFDPEVWRGNSVALPRGRRGNGWTSLPRSTLKSTQALRSQVIAPGSPLSEFAGRSPLSAPEPEIQAEKTQPLPGNWP